MFPGVSLPASRATKLQGGGQCQARYNPIAANVSAELVTTLSNKCEDILPLTCICALCLSCDKQGMES